MTNSRGRPPGLEARAVSAVAAGGALGSVGRHAVDLWLPHSASEFPWGTLLINISGSLVMGVLVAWLVMRPGSHPLMRPFLGVGVLGGWTTFSALAVQSVGLMTHGATLNALLYLVATFALGIAAILAGTVAGESLLGRLETRDDEEGMP